MKFIFIAIFIAVSFVQSYGQTKMPPSIEQSKSEPIKYIGEKQTDPRYHSGGLRSVVGVHRYQAFRANRDNPPEIGSRSGWTLNHQPYLCYWNEQFYSQYLSDQYSEHLPPGRTLLMTSKDGRNWSNPEIIFPEYSLPEINYVDKESGKTYLVPKGTKSVMHQRMGFYVTSDNRLLTLAFYGYSPTIRIGPNKGQGLGRVVREIYKDGTYGPIYFIRYNRHAGWNESNTIYPFYKESSDAGFVKACDELLNNKLITLQWWEEDRADDGFYTINLKKTINPGNNDPDIEQKLREYNENEPKAFNFYHRPDGVVVGIWKSQTFALSSDEGKTWTDFAISKSFKEPNAKMWGQKTSDGKYALVYDHSATRRNRYPMVVMTSENGYEFDNMLNLNGEVPPTRYYGFAKNTGPQYIRGIIEGNGTPPGNYMWNTYSMNKEDIWVTRTRVPISGIVDNYVNENFEDVNSESELEYWNLYIPQWAPIDIVKVPGEKNKVLQLVDEDPYDYASAERAFPPSNKATIEFSVFAKDLGKDILEFELHNENDERALRLRFDPRQELLNFDLGNVELNPVSFSLNKWYDVKISFNCDAGKYDVWLNGVMVREGIEFDENVKTKTLERMVFRTGSWRNDVRQFFLEGEPGAPGLEHEDLAGAGSKVPKSTFWIDNVKTYQNK